MTRWIISLPVIFPILFGTMVLIRPVEERRRRNILHMAVVLVNTGLSLYVILRLHHQELTLFHLYENVSLAFRLDGLGMVFGAMVSLLWPLATLYAFEYMEHEMRENSFFSFFTMTYGVTLGIAYSGNMMTMYLFYEMLTLVTIPLVMHTHSAKARQAGRLYAYYSIGGAALAFTSLIFIIIYGGSQRFAFGGFLDTGRASRFTLQVIYVMGFLGFGVKAALFPIHGWLIKASVAPTPVTALLHAVAVVKAGVFSILRLTYYCYDVRMLRGSWAQIIPLTLSVITVIYGGVMAIKEIHFKRRLAYSTISNLSYILMAACLMNPLGLKAAMAHMIAHAVSKICAFFVSGAVLVKTGYVFIPAMIGIGRKMKKTYATFIVASLSLCGIPGTFGFISKCQIIAAGFADRTIVGASVIGALFLAAVMSCIYMFSVSIRSLCQTLEGNQLLDNDLGDPGWRMVLPLMVFALVTVGLGIASVPLMNFLGQISQGIL